jgi:hypothetical protein
MQDISTSLHYTFHREDVVARSTKLTVKKPACQFKANITINLNA